MDQYIYRVQQDGAEPVLLKGRVTSQTAMFVLTMREEASCFRARLPLDQCDFTPEGAWRCYASRLRKEIEQAEETVERLKIRLVAEWEKEKNRQTAQEQAP